ncbi:MAG: septum formation initiator family protein [Verrucomicrobiae bacterium]|nr:septum formation initiator family protein [Verrucomicrobiae bacterium]
MRINSQLLRPAAISGSKRSQPRSFWSWLSQITQILIFLAAGILIYLFFVPSFDKSRELKRDLTNYDIEIDREKNRNDSLYQEADALNHDTDAIERLARDRLNLAREDELVFRFEPYEKQKATSANVTTSRQEPVW